MQCVWHVVPAAKQSACTSARVVVAGRCGYAAYVYGCMGVWVFGCMGVWVHGCMGVWVYGCMGVWVYGCMGVWVYGCMGVWVLVMTCAACDS